MGYVPGFDHDVFLSYAHDNNEDDGVHPRWVKSFSKQLSVKLLGQVGETVQVWWDDSDLDRSQVFDDVIEKAVRTSAIILSLVSPKYITRPYCGKELGWFTEQGNIKLASGHSRVFTVQLYRMPFADWPAACQGTSSFEFFDSGKDGFSHPLDIDSKAFADKQWDLVGELQKVLDEMRALRSAPLKPDASADRAAAFSIFLAASCDDLSADRTYLKKELLKQGIDVISKIPPPHEEKEHTEAARKAIESADLSVHLLGDTPGAPFDEDVPENTYAVAQTKLALDHAQSQVVLVPEAFSLDLIEKGPYADFMQTLQDRPRQSGRLQIIKAGRQQMLEEILAAKKSIEDRTAKAGTDAAQTTRTAFVDLHLKDLPHISDLIAYLADKNITAVTVPSAEQSPTAGMALFEQYLRTSQFFIVVFGSVARDWVANRVGEAFKLIIARQFQTRMGIYVAPPEKPAKDVQFQFCDVMLNAKKFDPASIDALLAHAAGAGD